MKIRVVTPAAAESKSGNRVTALRWAGIFRELGHGVSVDTHHDGQACDALVALHAQRSFESVCRFREAHPRAPLVVALTGTDVYGNMYDHEESRQSVEWADRLIVLQPLALDRLQPDHRAKARVIYQSLARPRNLPRPGGRFFDVCVLGHLRDVKDPLRAAAASRLVAPESKIRIRQVGSVLEPKYENLIAREKEENPRYQYLGALPRGKALRTLAASHLHCLTSIEEGGANAISEAIVVGVPSLASRNDGAVGLLGSDYSGFFESGDTEGLAALLERCERDEAFCATLRDQGAKLEPLFDPQREVHSWQEVWAELAQR